MYLGATIMLTQLWFFSLWICKTVQDSNSRRGTSWPSLGLSESFNQSSSHGMNVVVMSTLLFAAIPREGRLVVKREAAILVGVYHSGAYLLSPNWLATSKARKNSTQDSLRQSLFHLGKSYKIKGEKNHQPVIFWYLRCYLLLHAYLAF